MLIGMLMVRLIVKRRCLPLPIQYLQVFSHTNDQYQYNQLHRHQINERFTEYQGTKCDDQRLFDQTFDLQNGQRYHLLRKYYS